MEEKLNEISKNIHEIRWNGNGFLIFLCFMSMFVGCIYLSDIAQESKKTNTNLRTIINILNHDSIMDSYENDSEKVKEKSTNNKTK